MNSIHYTNDRKAREEVIKMIGTGKTIARFLVDRGHKNGLERHEITDTGLIIIYNNRTNRMVTKLIARPSQITRYNWKAPKFLIDKAREHQKLGYNLL